MRNYRAFLALAGVLAIGLCLRAWRLDWPPLWQDEAESGIYALQILAVGYPHAEFRGERLYETRSFIPSHDAKYEFESTNFYGSRFEKNKGWLPYYGIAAAFKFFGVGAWQARLPSVLAAGLTIILVFALSRWALGVPGSLAAAAAYAVNFFAIQQERQARYYALETFLLGWGVYCYGQCRRTKRPAWVVLTALALVLLFHTHAPAAIFLGICIVGHWLVSAPRLVTARPALWGAGVLVLGATVPWMVMVNYPAILRYAADDPLGFRPRWAVLVGVAALTWWFCQTVVRWLWRRSLTLGLGWSDDFRRIGRWCVGYLAVMPFAVPADSVALRLFAPLLPLMTVVGTALVWRWFVLPRAKFETTVGFIVFFAIGVGFFGMLYYYSWQRSAPYRSDWVPPLVVRLQQEQRFTGHLVLTDYHQFVLSFYSGMPVQLLSALRCEYLQTYPGPILYLTHQNSNLPGTRGSVIAVPYCDAQDAACTVRIAQLRACARDNRTCAVAVRDGSEIYDCSAPQRP